MDERIERMKNGVITFFDMLMFLYFFVGVVCIYILPKLAPDYSFGVAYIFYVSTFTWAFIFYFLFDIWLFAM